MIQKYEEKGKKEQGGEERGDEEARII